MRIDRLELHRALKLCKAAVAEKTPVTAFLYFWFDGHRVTAFNDVLGVEVPLVTDFTGGLPAALLLGLVEHSRAKHVDISVSGTTAVLKLAGARAKLPLLPIDQKVWECPKADKNSGVDLTAEMVLAFEYVGLSSATAGNYGSVGVTMTWEETGTYVYGTDGRSIAWEHLDPTVDVAPPLTMPRAFCDQLVTCSESGVLRLSDDSVLAELESGVRVFSRLLEKSTLDHRAALDRALPKNFRKKLVPIPTLFKAVLDRVGIFADIPKTSYSVAEEGNKLTVYVKTPAGELREVLPLGEALDSFSADYDSAMIRKVLSAHDAMLFTEACAVLTSGKNRGYAFSPMA